MGTDERGGQAKLMMVGLAGVKWATGKELKEKAEKALQEGKLTQRLLKPKWMKELSVSLSYR